MHLVKFIEMETFLLLYGVMKQKNGIRIIKSIEMEISQPLYIKMVLKSIGLMELKKMILQKIEIIIYMK